MSAWEQLTEKIDTLELRERVLVFVAIVFVVLALMKLALLDPLMAKQSRLTAQISQQQQQLLEVQVLAQQQSTSQNIRDKELESLRSRLAQLKMQLKDQDDYLQSRQDNLVEPNMMPGLLKQVLEKNGQLQLVELKTLPVGLLIEKPKAPADANAVAANPPGQSGVAAQSSAAVQNQTNLKKQIFKHGVQITVRGGYLEMLRYVAALEKLPVRMIWGEASLNVDKYPDSVLVLTLYTLSLDKTWLTL